jgi:MFS transporter, LPLT family, lysophospholipid transporter
VRANVFLATRTVAALHQSPVIASARAAHRMTRGFAFIMLAQFFSSLADNALLMAALALLLELDSPLWMTPLLKEFFVISYVLLAPFVGAFADSIPKGRVMFIANAIKVAGCLLMLFEFHPLPAYAIVGLGAAMYAPAKYGILTEILPAEKLVLANGWIEGLTVVSIILGTVMGGVLLSPKVSGVLLGMDIPWIDTGIDTPGEAAVLVTGVFYVIAAIFNLYIPHTGVDHVVLHRNPVYLIRDFYHCLTLLWKDKLGQISLATTTLFWGAGATLQFIVLKWAAVALNFPLSDAAMLMGVVAIGIAVGAVAAARFVPLRKSVSILSCGVLMGLVTMAMVFVHNIYIAIPLMVLIGALSGFFVVPMNALLQHRGHVLMGAGSSIAVQNFNENMSILIMLSVYAALIRYDVSINSVIVLFGLFITSSMVLVIRRHVANQAQSDSLHLIGVDKH